MLHVSAAGWAATLVALAALFGFDLVRSARRPHAVGFREAVVWSILYIAVALLFGVVFGLVAGWDLGTQYFAGYIVEKSLSVDNLFVFLIMSPAFARFRGTDWMQEPCRTCPLERQEQDWGGCRCQALRLAGDAAATDPVCRFSPHHDRVVTARESAETSDFTYRAMKPPVRV